MKTSNYILISFLTFVTLVLVGWHIDSKFYEDEYDKKRKARFEFNEINKWLKNNNSSEKKHEFLAITEEYLKYYDGYYDYARAASLLNKQFNMYKDSSNLELAIKWVDKAYQLKPKNKYVNQVYAKTLMNLGLDEKAKPYLDFVKKLDSINGIKYEEYKNDKGEIIKVRKRIN